MLEPKLVAFVRSSIPSVWALELLLLIRRASPQSLTSAELVQALRATPTLINRLLDGFVDSGLVEKIEPDAYRFQCALPETAELCEALALAAENRPIALRDVIIAAPNEKLRNLADAFRIKDRSKGPKGDMGK